MLATENQVMELLLVETTVEFVGEKRRRASVSK